MSYNERYVAYAEHNNKTPEEMLVHDRELYPGGHMVGFMIWISENIKRFRKEKPQAFIGSTLVDHVAFTTFLKGE